MGQPGSPANRDHSDAPPTSGEVTAGTARARPAISGRAPEGPAIAPLTKLISHIPPAPRVPKVDGISLIASTVSEQARGDGPDSPASAPRFVARKRAREVDAAQAWGAVIAAFLLGALIVWATSR